MAACPGDPPIRKGLCSGFVFPLSLPSSSCMPLGHGYWNGPVDGCGHGHGRSHGHGAWALASGSRTGGPLAPLGCPDASAFSQQCPVQSTQRQHEYSPSRRRLTCLSVLDRLATFGRLSHCKAFQGSPPPQGLALIFIPTGGDPSPLDPLPPSPPRSSKSLPPPPPAMDKLRPFWAIFGRVKMTREPLFSSGARCSTGASVMDSCVLQSNERAHSSRRPRGTRRKTPRLSGGPGL